MAGTGLDSILLRLSSHSTRIAGALVYVSLLAVLLGRNYQQARAILPVADLAAGANWVEDNTDPQAIIMTHDPVERYIHLRRHTIHIPAERSDLFAIDNIHADYILIAPPLRLPHSPQYKQAARSSGPGDPAATATRKPGTV